MRAAAARGLLETLVALGERQTNPVLPLLGDPPRIREGVRYPRNALRFGGHGLRAYYHSHGDPWRRDDEHGHFHLFVAGDDTEAAGWSHLAALGIDDQGQPRNWFTVNNWVTSGPWLPTRRLLERLDVFLARATNGEDLSLTERWLTHMLGVFRHRLPALLVARDNALQARQGERTLATTLTDRAIYELSRQPLDLQAELAAQLGLQNPLPTTTKETAAPG